MTTKKSTKGIKQIAPSSEEYSQMKDKLLEDIRECLQVGVRETGISYTLSEVDDTFFEDLC